MRKSLKLLFSMVFILSFGLILTSCSSQEEKVLKLAYVEWDSEVASTNVVRAVLEEKLGYKVEMLAVSAAAMWKGVATKDADAMVAAWLPTTHGHYLEAVKDDVEYLGPNLEGTQIGLVVPNYVSLNSIEDLKTQGDKIRNRIIGIDPGAGLMSATENVLKEYNLDNIELLEGSGATMTVSLDEAIKENKWIVVTGWSPHWKFARWDLKYLKDPKKVYGETEYISTVVRKGLKEEHPEAYQFLDKFNWTPEDMALVMVWNQESGASPYENAKRWVKENSEKVESWLR